MSDNATCEMPDSNPASAEIEEILKSATTIAVVGLSDKPERDSYRVASYLKENGYRIIPVNPAREEILGEKCYPDLTSVPEKIDIVDIFRSIDAIPGVVDEAIRVGAKTVWMQLGLSHRESAEKAREAGLRVVQARCIKIEHTRMTGTGGGITFNVQ